MAHKLIALHSIVVSKDKTIAPGEMYTTEDEAEAARLVEIGAAKHYAKPVSEPAPGINRERMKALITAIRGLDAKDETLFSGNGHPTVEALKAATGGGVTAAERDDAWALFLAAMSGEAWAEASESSPNPDAGTGLDDAGGKAGKGQGAA